MRAFGSVDVEVHRWGDGQEKDPVSLGGSCRFVGSRVGDGLDTGIDQLDCLGSVQIFPPFGRSLRNSTGLPAGITLDFSYFYLISRINKLDSR